MIRALSLRKWVCPWDERVCPWDEIAKRCLLHSSIAVAGSNVLSTQEHFSDRAPEFFGTERETLGIGLLGVYAGDIGYLILVVGGGLVDYFGDLLGARTFLATLRIHEG